MQNILLKANLSKIIIPFTTTGRILTCSGKYLFSSADQDDSKEKTSKRKKRADTVGDKNYFDF